MARESILYTKVGKHAKDDSTQIKLFGTILEPKKRSKGNIVFLGGFSGDFCDYQEYLLEPLAEDFTVYTYNYRGHGLSKGTFNHKLNISDLETFLKKVQGPTHILAHSYGANLATQLNSEQVQKLYCIEPMFNFDMLSKSVKRGINLATIAEKIKILGRPIDFLLDITDIRKKHGFHNTKLLQSSAELRKVKIKPYTKPMAFTFTNNNFVFGTSNPEKYNSLIQLIQTEYPQAVNKSELVQGLNHCLNFEKMAPFNKPEKGKNNQEIIDYIINFYLN